jgi:sulfate transport system permease protein
MTTLALPFGIARPRSALPGFGQAMGITLLWLSIVVLLPLIALALRPWELGIVGVWEIVTTPRALAALRLSFGAALLAAAIDVPLGLLITWVLIRYRFPGRGAADAMIDLPFALPTAVAGVALATLCGPSGLIGKAAAEWGIKIAFTPLGIWVALVFIGLPFVVRTVQPVLADLEPEIEEAAATLGAGRWRTVTRVVLPAVAPAAAAGFAMAFARGVGEYGSVIFIAGNLPMESEIAPLLITVRLEEYDYGGAAAIASVMLLVSLALLAVTAVLQRRLEKEHAR